MPDIPVSPFMHTPNRQIQAFHSLTLRKPDVSAELVSAGSLLRERVQRQNLKPTVNNEDYIEKLGSAALLVNFVAEHYIQHFPLVLVTVFSESVFKVHEISKVAPLCKQWAPGYFNQTGNL
jgi:hypothetical protein